jgi:hypothetical protein
MAGFSLSLTLAVAFFLSNGSFSGISTPFLSGLFAVLMAQSEALLAGHRHVFVTMPPVRSPRGRIRGASTGIRRRTTSARPGAPMRLALPAMTEKVDPVMRDRETGAGLHAF